MNATDTFLSYETYKITHLFFIMLFISLAAVSLWYGGRNKMLSMVIGIATLLILVSGMGLVATLGFKHGEPWPLWIKIKMALWLLVAVLVPLIQKKFPKLGKITYIFTMGVFLIIFYTVVHKIS